jgi:hypothetical protein
MMTTITEPIILPRGNNYILCSLPYSSLKLPVHSICIYGVRMYIHVLCMTIIFAIQVLGVPVIIKGPYFFIVCVCA